MEQVQRETGFGSPKTKPLRENKGQKPPGQKGARLEFLRDQNYCFGWNQGDCADPCPNSRVRLCILCRGGHRLRDCPTAPADVMDQFAFFRKNATAKAGKDRKGKGRGKGKAK